MGEFVMHRLFPIVCNMSLTASVVILAVLAVRLLLRRAPKVFSYALWAVVLFRLLCPVSVTSAVSLLGALGAPAQERSAVTSVVEYVPADIVRDMAPTVMPLPQEPFPAEPGENIVSTAPSVTQPDAAPVSPLSGPVAVLTLTWLTGMALLLLYSVVSLLRLRRRLVGAVRLEDNIYLADYIPSPFVMGLFRPKIYLPSTLTETERGYILRHEQYHLRRRDHVVKLLSFLALCVHWFNPLVWAAFILAGKDMEMSCDEAVVRELGEDIRADYSASLLSLATGRRIVAGMPLAFGEGDTGGRIRNLLNWKRPQPWIIGRVRRGLRGSDRPLRRQSQGERHPNGRSPGGPDGNRPVAQRGSLRPAGDAVPDGGAVLHGKRRRHCQRPAPYRRGDGSKAGISDEGR